MLLRLCTAAGVATSTRSISITRQSCERQGGLDSIGAKGTSGKLLNSTTPMANAIVLHSGLANASATRADYLSWLMKFSCLLDCALPLNVGNAALESELQIALNC